MTVIELRSFSGEAVRPLLQCDVCIIGSGPAGSTMAEALSNSPLRVTVLESGGTERSANADALNEIENIGRPRADQWSVRNRILGGSSHTWGGRCGEFDEIDYEARPWIAHSGWPIDQDDVKPFLDRSARYLGLLRGSGVSDERFWTVAGRKPPAKELDPQLLRPFFWQFSRDPKESYPYEYTRFGRNLEKRVGPNVTLVTGATVQKIHTDETGRTVRTVEFVTADGESKRLSASIIVLCCGGIENTRILLNSDKYRPDGLGNDSGNLGRYLMDHLRGPVAYFDPLRTSALQKRYGRYNVDGRFFRAGFRLSPDIQRREQLINCASWLGEIRAEDDPWDALRRIIGGAGKLPADAVSVVANSHLLLRGLKDHFAEKNGVPRKLSELTLECMSEQVPDPESRITLSERRDPLGMRLPRVDWRASREEARSMHRTAHITAKEFARLGLPAPRLADWVLDEAAIPDSFVDVAHPTGTTRMSRDPAHGVVDVNCQVHGISGLYVAGSSVFPTAGHCNPTQMIVAMSIRLSDHIAQQMGKRAATLSTEVTANAATRH